LSSLNPTNFVVRFTYVKITGKRKILLGGMESHSRGFQRNISQDGHFREENTKTAAFRWLASLLLLPPCMRNTTKKVLIVDENDACRQSLGVSIKGLGYEVFEAATGPEAIDKASSMHPDLIMMDLRLPGMNGDEATVRLKRNLSTRNIPVVISTAWTTACNVGDRANRALDAGAAEILYKPFHLTMLRDVLRTYLLA
jgi:two-component system cell cycle response regulator DivK